MDMNKDMDVNDLNSKSWRKHSKVTEKNSNKNLLPYNTSEGGGKCFSVHLSFYKLFSFRKPLQCCCTDWCHQEPQKKYFVKCNKCYFYRFEHKNYSTVVQVKIAV